VLLTKGYGYKDPENKKPVTETALFAIGSGTKAFTVSLANYLVTDLGLDFDAPITNYFPELRF
jgi:CubicO group peptidase (beta-lactamase class C family)